jgi:photosystem II stability/assembly factor-like uncharacterized protein
MRERTAVRRLGLVATVAVTLVLAGCTSSAVPTTSSTSTSTTTHPTNTTEPISTAAACTASQVTVGGFGSSGAAGTGVSTIRIENTSSSPCSLRGYPVVTFLGNASSRFDPAAYPAHVLRVAVGHTSFFGDVSRVVLPPGQAASAGFVITNYDNEGGTTCPTATSIRVKLPDMRQSFTVGVAVQVIGILLCPPASAAYVSPIVKGAVLAVSPENLVATNAQPTDPHINPTAVTGAAGYLWMLGTYPCSARTCPVLMRSTDGGKSFVRVGTPPVGMYGIEFANHEDGYVYSAGTQGDLSRLYSTDDGGKSWRLAFARFRAPVVVTGSRAYALVPEDCSTEGQCKSLKLSSSVVGGDAWRESQLPLTVDQAENPFGWAAFGSKVWLILTSVSTAQVLRSHDGGRTFSELTPGGYVGGLGCSLSATSLTTLWGFCVTGNGGYGIRSTDGGKNFVTVLTPGGLSNAVEIYPVSGNEAIFVAGGLWLTRNGGRHFSSLLRVPQSYQCEVALASATTWFVFGFSGYGPPNLMWRTNNGGRSWQSVKSPSVTATMTVSRADLSRFVALAHRGLREPFEAAYRFVPPLGRWGGHVYDFRVWSEPAVGSFPEGNFVYESPFGRGTFRFIQTGRGGDYECLEMAPRTAWKCVGPFGPQTVGQIMLVEGYRLPMVVAEDLSAGLVGPLGLSHRAVLGRRLWCLNVANNTFAGVLCLTKTGQLAFDDKLFIGPRELELVSLELTGSKSVFLLPARPKPWMGELLPNLCGKVQCPSLGML